MTTVMEMELVTKHWEFAPAKLTIMAWDVKVIKIFYIFFYY